MQKVGAYLLERRDNMDWTEPRAAEAKRLREEVTKWLGSKGASSIGPQGTFLPEDGSEGTYRIDEALDRDRSWWMVRLHEQTRDGRLFSTGVSITSTDDQVKVYVTLETGRTTTQIVPVSVDPRCPKIIRDVLRLPGPWYHGTSTLRHLRDVRGFDDGAMLAEEIMLVERAIPVIVVSTNNNRVALPELDIKLAQDLAGLANIFVVDEDASWGITDALGVSFSCYGGSVRIYWLHFSREQDPFLCPFWTGDRLTSAGRESLETRDRFRQRVREMLFRAAALSVIRPREIDDIRDAAGRGAAAVLRQRASSLEEYEKLADSYSQDNDSLRKERAQLRERVEDLQGQLAKLEADRQALSSHLRDAKTAPPESESPATADLAPAASIGDPISLPEPGEVRFYKKRHATPSHDVMIYVQDCGCNNWESAHSADKRRRAFPGSNRTSQTGSKCNIAHPVPAEACGRLAGSASPRSVLR
jgi:hypothetical protein